LTLMWAQSARASTSRSSRIAGFWRSGPLDVQAGR
jgi:hypothetical protein